MLNLTGDYFTATLFLQTLSMPVFCVFFAAIVALIFANPRVRRTRYMFYFWVAFGAALLGAVIGQITGQSREPAVSAVLPAVLGLVGGTTIYLVGTQGLRSQVIVGISLVAMMLNMIIGIGWGARLRSISQEFAAVSEADNNYRGALRQLKHEITFSKVKSLAENDIGLDLQTEYPVQQPDPKE